MTEIEERLMRELMTNKELEATCLQLRNEVLHIQGEVKRARREGAADMQASVAEFTSKRADECAKYHRESLTDTDGYWDHAREEISIMAKRIARGDHLDGSPSPLEAIRREERAKGRGGCEDDD